jgi:hypothetical protein
VQYLSSAEPVEVLAGVEHDERVEVGAQARGPTSVQIKVVEVDGTGDVLRIPAASSLTSATVQCRACVMSRSEAGRRA